MGRLGAGEDLDIIEVVQCTNRFSICVWVISEGGDYVEGLEHIARQIGGMCARCKTEGDIANLARMHDGRDGRVERK